MKKILLFLVSLIFSINCFGQTSIVDYKDDVNIKTVNYGLVTYDYTLRSLRFNDQTIQYDHPIKINYLLCQTSGYKEYSFKDSETTLFKLKYIKLYTDDIIRGWILEIDEYENSSDKAPKFDSKELNKNSSVQCKGITKSGKRCKNITKNASGYCHIHSR